MIVDVTATATKNSTMPEAHHARTGQILSQFPTTHLATCPGVPEAPDGSDGAALTAQQGCPVSCLCSFATTGHLLTRATMRTYSGLHFLNQTPAKGMTR